jgi:hypothetical protein
MWNFETTKGWEQTSQSYIESNPLELGLLLANLSRYLQIANAMSGNCRVELDGLTEEDMGIVTIAQLGSTAPNLLIAFVYPDAEKCIAILIRVGKQIDKHADMEYAKGCIHAYVN